MRPGRDFVDQDPAVLGDKHLDREQADEFEPFGGTRRDRPRQISNVARYRRRRDRGDAL